MLNITHYQRNANQNHSEVHFMPARMAAIQKSTSNKRWRGCGEKGTLLHCWWDCKLVQPLWRTVWRFLKKLEVELPYDPAVPLLGVHTEETRIEGDTGTPLQYSCLENPMDRGAWKAAVQGVAEGRTQLSDFIFTFMHWRRKWQSTPVFLPGESHGQRSLVGYGSPWGSQRVRCI